MLSTHKNFFFFKLLTHRAGTVNTKDLIKNRTENKSSKSIKTHYPQFPFSKRMTTADDGGSRNGNPFVVFSCGTQPFPTTQSSMEQIITIRTFSLKSELMSTVPPSHISPCTCFLTEATVHPHWFQVISIRTESWYELSSHYIH